MKLLLPLFFIFMLTSCATFSKKVSFTNQQKLDKQTVAKINGFYELQSLKSMRKFENLKPDLVEKQDSIDRFPLYITLKTNAEYQNGTNFGLENYKVKIEVKNSKTISISLCEENKTLEEIILNYKIKRGYLYLKNGNFKTKWIPGLCGNFEVDRIRIGINSENNLILNHSHYIYGAVLFIIGDTKKTSFGSEYKRQI
jgi:hypothetical protein